MAAMPDRARIDAAGRTGRVTVRDRAHDHKGIDRYTMNTIGFISAPAWFDPAPSEFPSTVTSKVRTQQAPLLLPDFDYALESIAAAERDLEISARSLKAMGCDLAAQVGSPFAWALVDSEDDARRRCETVSRAANIPVVMTGIAIIDALRTHGVKTVAATCTYYEDSWRRAFVAFLQMCGFDVGLSATLTSQGLVTPNMPMRTLGWAMREDLTRDSILALARSAPEADAIVVTGAGARTLPLLPDLEHAIDRPIVAADTVLYWAIARALKLDLTPRLGSLSRLT